MPKTSDLNPTTTRATCEHCGLPVPAGLIEADAPRQFCCAGCRAVYETIHSCGLDEYYRLLDSADATLSPAAPAGSKFESFDSETFEKLYVRSRGGSLKQCELVLEGVTCVACVWLLEKLPGVLDGVVEARLNLRESTLTVTWDAGKLPLSRIAQALDRFGYRPHPPRGGTRKELLRREERRKLIHLGASFALMGNVMLLALALYAGMFGGMENEFWHFFRWISLLLGSVALAWPGATFFRSAYLSLRTRTPNLDVPIALALAAGWIAGIVNVVIGRGEIYFDSLCVLVFLLLVGRYLQFRQQRRVDTAVELLFSLTPQTCRVVRGDEVSEQPTDALVEGDVVEIRGGDLVCADGVIVSGMTSVNQALLTGESRPVPLGPGDQVHAGAQNLTGTVRMKVEQVGEQTRVGQLMKLIEQGIREKPPIVQFADRVGQWFVVVVSIAAVATFGYWAMHGPVSEAIDHAVALLIVTCPCVLGLATPLTMSVAIGRLARRGILVKNATVIERLAGDGTILLDKTGTLTLGQMKVVEWRGDESMQPVVAEIERRVMHPIATAIVEAFGDRELPADVRLSIDAVETGEGGVGATVGGRRVLIGSRRFLRRAGVLVPADLSQAIDRAERSGITGVLVARDGLAVAAVSVGDALRDDSASIVRQLDRAGWSPRIVSGDATAVVETVGRAVGIAGDRVRGEVSPEEKLQAVRDHQRHGRVVMVGDGVNDAAALAAAEVGIAVHGGAEASLAAADVYVARPGLRGVCEVVHLSRRTLAIVRRNLVVSGGYNLLAGVLAAMGLMNPLLAAIIMPISSATVLTLALGSVSRAEKGLPCR
jgi:Cu2+-exporting ATPase